MVTNPGRDADDLITLIRFDPKLPRYKEALANLSQRFPRVAEEAANIKRGFYDPSAPDHAAKVIIVQALYERRAEFDDAE